MQVYETAFENKRKTVVDVFEYGQLLVRLQPGETRHVESRSPKTSYARWSRLTFKNGKIDFDENSKWEWPYPGMLMLEFLNVDGAATESLGVAGEYYHCDKQIPKLIPVDIHDKKWALVARLEWKFVEHKEKDGDYFKTVKKLEMVKTERSKKEIKKIKEQLLDEAIEKTKHEMERHFLPSQESKNE